VTQAVAWAAPSEPGITNDYRMNRILSRYS
jgi:hypothetical protein